MTLQERKDKQIYSQKHQRKNKHKDRQKKFEPKKQNNQNEKIAHQDVYNGRQKERHKRTNKHIYKNWN